MASDPSMIFFVLREATLRSLRIPRYRKSRFSEVRSFRELQCGESGRYFRQRPSLSMKESIGLRYTMSLIRNLKAFREETVTGMILTTLHFHSTFPKMD